MKLQPVETEAVKRIEGLKDGTELYRLAFRIDPSFLDGTIELRFPEVLQSAMGFHFLDHYRTTLFPLSEPDPFPQWQRDWNGKKVWYTHQTSEGLVFGGCAEVFETDVALSFYVENRSSAVMYKVEPNMCLEFSGSPGFSPNDLSKINIVSGGKLKKLSDALPVPIKNSQVWPLILTKNGVDVFQMPSDSPSWTLIDDVAEENLMAIQSDDGRCLVGYAWDTMPLTQMSNCRYPCLHTGPGPVDLLQPGQRHTWRGKIYFMENSQKDCLLDAFRRDWQNWTYSVLK